MAEQKPLEDWDSIDFDAEFQRMTSNEELHLLDQQVTWTLPDSVTVICPEDSVSVKIVGERTFITINADTPTAKGVAEGHMHAQDHNCVPAQVWLTQFMRYMAEKVKEGFEKAGHEFNLEEH